MVLGAAALWGTLALFARHLYAAGLTPLEVASLRAFTPAAVIGLWLLRRPESLRVARRDLPFFLLYGLVSIALFHTLYLAAVQHTTVAIAVALLYTAPAFVVLLSRLWLGEAIGRAKLVALLLVLSGAFLVTGALRLLAADTAAVTPTALLLGLGAGFTYALYTLLGKRALGRYTPLQTVFFAFLFGAAALALVAPPWTPLLRHPEAILPALLLGLLPTLTAYVLYIGALRYLPASTASMLATLEPVVATVLGVTVLGEALGVDQVVGMGLILGAALLLSLPRPPRSSPSARRTRRG
jgi:drug/metabolite transporter (DMT)-like permease